MQSNMEWQARLNHKDIQINPEMELSIITNEFIWTTPIKRKTFASLS